MKSQIFYTDKYKGIEVDIAEHINSLPDFMSVRTATSTRAAGDALQDILSEDFQAILGDVCAEYSSAFVRRAMADLAFTDANGFYYVVDVKTHRLTTSFNMLNLTSVERISRFYEDDRNYFVLLMVKYEIANIKINVQKVYFTPIEFLSWNV